MKIWPKTLLAIVICEFIGLTTFPIIARWSLHFFCLGKSILIPFLYFYLIQVIVYAIFGLIIALLIHRIKSDKPYFNLPRLTDIWLNRHGIRRM